VLLDVDDDEAAYLLLTHDEIGRLAELLRQQTSTLLDRVRSQEGAVQDLLQQIEARAGWAADGASGGANGAGSVTPHASLADSFLVPPFSVLDARQAYWQERKRAWLALGIQSEVGRGESVTSHITPDGHTLAARRLTWVQGSKQDLDETSRKILAAGRRAHTSATDELMERAGGFPARHASGTSIFDPVLCEVVYRWFSPPGAAVLDPFAGGSVRGIVAAVLGRSYTGIDLRPEQIAANQAQAEAILPAMPRPAPGLPVPLPPLRLTPYGTVTVVRDDDVPGGTKVRALLAWLPTLDAEEVVYASPAQGFAQVALAYAARACGKRAVIFVAQRQQRHPCTQASAQAGARIEEVPHGYLSHVQAKAQSYCDRAGALLLPFGFDTPPFLAALARIIGDAAPPPAEAWCVAGSGVLARAMRLAWPGTPLRLVCLGKEPIRPEGDVQVYHAAERFEAPALLPPPFPSCLHYDAKAWTFVQRHAVPGALFWNVAGDPPADVVALAPAPRPQWLAGDAGAMATLLPADAAYDLVFTCPPYGDLERYSDDVKDLSTMPHEAFLAAYRAIITSAMARLRPDRFAAIVVGDFRDRQGYYRNFVSDTIAAFEAAGARLYNEAILVTAVGSLPLRVGQQFTAARKLGKTHQNVLLFVKGDARRATAASGPIDVTLALEQAALAAGLRMTGAPPQLGEDVIHG